MSVFQGSGHGWWKKSVAKIPSQINPIVAPKFRIDRQTKIATAGSCFAQYLSRHLQRGQHNFYVAEAAPGLLNPEEARAYHYGLFSARYGNIYTSRGLLQLLKRAFDLWHSCEPAWQDDTGRFIDPLRPLVQPGGYISIDEMAHDRKNHLAAVRAMIENLEVSVFTLGLTELWERKSDGTVFPACPGCGHGRFDGALYQFRNLTVADVIADLTEVIALIKIHNPDAKLLLSVSPVPLNATYSGRHVVQATSYSKSVLCAAAEDIRSSHDDVDYLPSYKIITGSFAPGHYFEPDLRTVTDSGIHRVMRPSDGGRVPLCVGG